MGIPWTIMRPPTVYGPRDTEVLKLFKFAKMGIVPVLGSGEQENSFVYVADLVEAIHTVLGSPGAGKTYFPSHTEIFTQRELVSHIATAMGRGDGARVVRIPEVIARNALWVTGTVASLMRQATLLNADRANDFLAKGWTCSPDALESDLGWRAEIDLPSGLKRTAEWYRESQWL